jgi:8-oxo-dGTP diphosphatase
MKKLVKKQATGGILIFDNRALIIQRAKDEKYLPSFWEIPSGKKEPFESLKAAAEREFKEETGIAVRVVKPVHVFKYLVEKETDIRDVTQTDFLVKAKGKPKVTLSAEHQNYAWLSKEEIDNYDLSKEIKEALKKAFGSL